MTCHVLSSLTRWIRWVLTFEMSVNSIHERLQVNAEAIQWPIGAEDDFEAIIDLITQESLLPS